MLKKRLFSLVLLFSSCWYAPGIICAPAGSPLPQQNAPFPGFDPNMSEEDFLNQLMEEINSALPEEERESFWQEVAKETERLEKATENMSESEKEKYLMDLITAAPGEEVPAQTPTPEIEKAPIKEEIAKPVAVPQKEAKELKEILDNIIKMMQSFLNKAAAFPDFDGKMAGWVKNKRFTDWQDDQTWQTFKNQLNLFMSRLERFKEKDPKIGLKHIDALAKNEAVIDNLKQLEAKLSREVPLIEMSVFAIQKMSNQTKNAITHTINALTESLYRTKLPDELLKILAEFDPVAKKLFDEEEKARKAAIEAQKRYQPTQTTRVIGKKAERGLSLPSLDDLGYPSPKRSRTPTGKGGQQKMERPQQKKPTDKKGTGSDKKQESKKKPKDEKKTIDNPDIKRHVDNFAKDLKDAHDMVINAQP